MIIIKQIYLKNVIIHKYTSMTYFQMTFQNPILYIILMNKLNINLLKLKNVDIKQKNLVKSQ